MEELQVVNQSGQMVSAPENPWVAIIQQSVEKNADIATIEKFIHLQREEEDRQAKRAFNKSMSNLQGMIPEISKTGNAAFGNTSYNFDKLNDICNALRPLLQQEGLSFSFKMKQEQSMITVQCTVSHEAGHSEFNSMSSLPDDSGKKNSIQQIASTNTYLQRYTLKAAFGISSADDDGHASTKLANDKAGKEGLETFKATVDEGMNSRQTLEELEKFKTECVNYVAKIEPSFCREIYNKFEAVKKQKGW